MVGFVVCFCSGFLLWSFFKKVAHSNKFSDLSFYWIFILKAEMESMGCGGE
jgi:hypothetical protein